ADRWAPRDLRLEGPELLPPRLLLDSGGGDGRDFVDRLSALRHHHPPDLLPGANGRSHRARRKGYFHRVLLTALHERVDVCCCGSGNRLGLTVADVHLPHDSTLFHGRQVAIVRERV